LGVHVVRRRRPTPCRQSSTTHPRCGARRPRSPPGQTAGAMHPRMNSAGAASFAGRTSLLQEVVCGKVAARGRAASPTKRGRIVRSDKDLSRWVFYKGIKGTNQVYPPCTRRNDRGLLDAPCTTSPQCHFDGPPPSWRPCILDPFFFEKCIPPLGIFYKRILEPLAKLLGAACWRHWMR
jgi:hypothetical protein